MVFRRKEKEEEAPLAPSDGGVADQDATARADPIPDENGLSPLWYLERRLRDELARAPRVNATFSLAAWRLRMLPGETPRPELLERASSLIGSSLRTYDVAAWIDQERIVALLFDASYEAGSTVAYRLKSKLQLQAQSMGKWQAGIACFPNDGVDGDALIQAAFRRLEEDTRAA